MIIFEKLLFEKRDKLVIRWYGDLDVRPRSFQPICLGCAVTLGVTRPSFTSMSRCQCARCNGNIVRVTYVTLNEISLRQLPFAVLEKLPLFLPKPVSLVL